MDIFLVIAPQREVPGRPAKMSDLSPEESRITCSTGRSRYYTAISNNQISFAFNFPFFKFINQLHMLIPLKFCSIRSNEYPFKLVMTMQQM